MTDGGWREAAWSKLSTPWDVVVVGGGITGAGIAREAGRHGLRVLLVEQGDFASGTSSRSSKLVHGGLRYLAQGNLRLTWESVRERDRLLRELPGLVEATGFLMASYTGDKRGPRLISVGLRLYDLFGSGVRHRVLSSQDLLLLAPRLRLDKLLGGFWYRDAQTDDARLVLRVLFEAIALGAEAINYARVEDVILEGGRVAGVVLRDREGGRVARVSAKAVVNATGAWADGLRAGVQGKAAIRPLRGSHLVFPSWRFPVAQAVAFMHPVDGRPLFAYPWEGATLLGTTDLDHDRPLDEEPVISPGEAAYMVEAARGAFPGLDLKVSDAVSSYSGVRPVIGTGKKDPSKESREHVIWNEKGLVTVTGGKLTTFRGIARHALEALRDVFPALPRRAPGDSHFSPGVIAGFPRGLEVADRRRLEGRFGPRVPELVRATTEGDLERVAGTPYSWAELRFAARTERVMHLEDLLLRRTRLGLLLPEAGREHLFRVREVCQPELGWTDERWDEEVEHYLETCQRHHGAPRASSGEAPPAPRASAPRTSSGARATRGEASPKR